MPRKPPPPPPPSFVQFARGGDRPNVVRLGAAREWSTDLYHRLIRLGWRAFFAWFGAVFVAINLVFALAYLADPGGLTGDEAMRVESPFLRAFFFSVHTIATVGYGNVTPRSLYANVVVVVEIACGILLIALTSGLMFARFSRPTARVLFSEVAVIRPFNGVPTLMFRAANQRTNFILEASVRLSLLRSERDGDKRLARLTDLALLRDNSPMFSLSWLVMHPIDEASPLYAPEGGINLAASDQLVVMLTGMDSTMAQTIHARHGYEVHQILRDHDFVDVVGTDGNSARFIDYRRFHDVEPLTATEG